MEFVQSNRKLWIDALRSVAMLLVVYGHCVRDWSEFFIFTSPVKMPLFFIISGYLFNPRNGNTHAFFKNLLIKLVIPWLVLGMIHPTNPITRFTELISGKVLWFMPCLIISESIWFFIRKYTHGFSNVITIGVAISAIGYILSRWQIFDYAMFSTALIVQLFFVIGFVINKQEIHLKDNWIYIISFGIPLYIALSIAQTWLFPGQIIDVHLNKYFSITYCLTIIIVGCSVLFCVFEHFNVSNRLLVYIGQNTLLIYIAHGLGINLFASLFSSTCVSRLPMPIYALFQTSFSIIVCSVLAYFFNRYLPELVGKKRK